MAYYCSIRRMEYPEFQTGIFGRMESAPAGFLRASWQSWLFLQTVIHSEQNLYPKDLILRLNIILKNARIEKKDPVHTTPKTLYIYGYYQRGPTQAVCLSMFEI